MKTKLKRSPDRISLVVDTGKGGEIQVLASMTKFEGTPCWKLIDVRLKDDPEAHEYSGDLDADDAWASISPQSKEEANLIKAKLKEFKEKNGKIHWCTFNGIVRGEVSINGVIPPTYRSFERPVFHSMDTGLRYLKEAKAYWETHEGPIVRSKIENPYAQPSRTMVMDSVWEHRRETSGLTPF